MRGASSAVSANQGTCGDSAGFAAVADRDTGTARRRPAGRRNGDFACTAASARRYSGAERAERGPAAAGRTVDGRAAHSGNGRGKATGARGSSLAGIDPGDTATPFR